MDAGFAGVGYRVSTLTDIEVIPFDAALGAEVRCGDVRAASDTVIARISQASLDHQVVLIRAQTLSDAELSAFGKRFGELQLSNPLPSPLANWCGTPICRASPRQSWRHEFINN